MWKLNMPRARSANLKLAKDLVFEEAHFFIQNAGCRRVRANKFIHPIVKVGQTFGIIIDFKPINAFVKYKVELRVPHSPERFPSHDCILSISPDNLMVTVENSIPGEKGFAGFYWDTKNGDPIGTYVMSMIIEDQIFSSYVFEIVNSLH